MPSEPATLTETASIHLPHRALAAVGAVGQWVLYFGIAFSVTAGVLLLAHV